MFQLRIPFFPEGAQAVNEHIAMLRAEGKITFFDASGPIYSCSEDDRYGIRLAQCIIVENTTVRPAQMARALGIERSTVYRNVKKYREGGASALFIERDNRRGHKLSDTKLVEAQTLLDQGQAIVKVAAQIGVTEGCIRHAIAKGTLVRRKPEKTSKSLSSLSERSSQDAQCAGGVAVKRESERLLASIGQLDEAMPEFSAHESVPHAGVLLSVPLLLQLGLLDAGQKVYGRLRKGFYGLRSILLTLSFMALLRIKTPEQMKGKAPGELGIILGLDRWPEVKTLRRKLAEMGVDGKGSEYMAFLTERWSSEASDDVLGFMYIDGHVRPYHGRKHKLPKTHVARRRLCMPATTDFWVNDANCEPLFLITAEANNGLLSILENEIMPEMRKQVGGDRRITLVFDREGWSPRFFARCQEKGFDVITYRKGKYDPWPEACFSEVQSQVGGKPITYRLGERSEWVGKTLWMREVRRLCDSGHQTSVMTTRQDLDIEEIARRMFFRWNQENFFRYMRQEYGLDHLVSYDVEQADGDRLMPCPKRKEKAKMIARWKLDLNKLRQDYGQKAFEAGGRPLGEADETCRREISMLEQQIKVAKAELKAMPVKVPVKEAMSEHEIVRLEREKKFLTDSVKMLSYRAETGLLNLVAPYFNRANEEGRAFLKSLLDLSADIVPDEEAKTLTVKFHSMSNQRSNRALQELCETMTAQNCCFPQTNLRLIFQPPIVASSS